MSEHGDPQERNSEIHAFLDEVERNALAEKGCCTIEWPDGSRAINGVTRDDCIRAAREVGGTFHFSPGRSC